VKEILAPCSSCIRTTTHRVLHEVAQDADENRQETYAMLECAGCHTISMGCRTRHYPNGEVEHTYYPSPVSRKEPPWVFYLRISWSGAAGDEAIGELLHEVYQAIHGGQHRLAAMGIRALLEQVMISKVGDLKTFEEKMDAFQKNGFVSLIQRDAMRETLEIGHAAMHRSFKPTERELNIALDIVEGILAAIFDHSEAAATLAKRVPPRPTKPTQP